MDHDVAKLKNYLQSSWSLSQSGTNADHDNFFA